MTTATTASNGSQPSSLSGWQQRSLHAITCPSGQRLRIRIPGVATLLEHGDLPDDLVDVALQEVTHRDGAAGAFAEQLQSPQPPSREETLDALARFARFQRQLVCAAVAEVEQDGEWAPIVLTLDDLDLLPEDDLAMVAEIVQRLRSTDAAGVRIGVEPLDRWAMFREAHSCPDPCGSCQQIVERLSSVDVGQV